MTARLIVALREHAARYRVAVYPGRDGDPYRTPSLLHHATTRRRHRAGERLGAAVADAARQAPCELPAA